MSARPLLRDRYSFGNLEKVLELPDLIAVQHESFNWLMESGLKGIFSDISPITDVSETLSLELEFDPKDIDLRPPPKFTVLSLMRMNFLKKRIQLQKKRALMTGLENGLLCTLSPVTRIKSSRI